MAFLLFDVRKLMSAIFIESRLHFASPLHEALVVLS